MVSVTRAAGGCTLSSWEGGDAEGDALSWAGGNRVAVRDGVSYELRDGACKCKHLRAVRGERIEGIVVCGELGIANWGLLWLGDWLVEIEQHLLFCIHRLQLTSPNGVV